MLARLNSHTIKLHNLQGSWELPKLRKHHELDHRVIKTIYKKTITQIFHSISAGHGNMGMLNIYTSVSLSLPCNVLVSQANVMHILRWGIFSGSRDKRLSIQQHRQTCLSVLKKFKHPLASSVGYVANWHWHGFA